MTGKEADGTLVYSLIYEKICNTRAIGGHIPVDDFPEWDEFVLRCKRYGIPLNKKGGVLHMLKAYNKLVRVTFPDAFKCHCDPLVFTDAVLDAAIPIISAMETDRIRELALAHGKEVTDVNKKFSSGLNDVIKKNVENVLKTEV